MHLTQLSGISSCMCTEPALVSSADLSGWVSLEGRLPPAEEVVQPKRLLQQIHSQEELPHSRLDTRVNNHTTGVQVNEVLTCFISHLFMQTVSTEHAHIIIPLHSILVFCIL